MSSFAPSRFLISLAIVCLALGGSEPTQAEFATDLRAALDIHEKASSLEEQAVALEAFRKAVAEHPENWLGHFWTAYEETQIAMLRKRKDPEAELDDYLERAQSHLDKAQKLHTAATDRERSSFTVLQGLIYRFRAWFDEAEADRWTERYEDAVRQAAAIDPDNPVVLVMVGTELVRQGQSNDDYKLLLAANRLMRLGRSEAEAAPDRSQTTYFNSEWVQFWLPMSEEALTKLIDPS